MSLNSIAPAHEAAQILYCRMFSVNRISLIESQHIAGHINSGKSDIHAAGLTHMFVAQHRLALEYASQFEPGIASQNAYENFFDNF